MVFPRPQPQNLFIKLVSTMSEAWKWSDHVFSHFWQDDGSIKLQLHVIGNVIPAAKLTIEVRKWLFGNKPCSRQLISNSKKKYYHYWFCAYFQKMTMFYRIDPNKPLSAPRHQKTVFNHEFSRFSHKVARKFFSCFLILGWPFLSLQRWRCAWMRTPH